MVSSSQHQSLISGPGFLTAGWLITLFFVESQHLISRVILRKDAHCPWIQIVKFPQQASVATTTTTTNEAQTQTASNEANNQTAAKQRKSTPTMVKRKQGGVIAPQTNETLNQLLDIGPPPLCKDNMGMQSTGHTEDTGHEPAIVTESSTIPLILGEELHVVHASEKTSRLLLELGDKSGLVYQNETEVKQYVLAALADAIETQGLSSDLTVRHESSVFAYRPDIIIVYHSCRGAVLVIGVKKPGHEVFTSEDVGGQVYDYLVGELGMGISMSFAVLTSYDAMCIAHLDDNGASRALLERTAEALDQPLDRSCIDQMKKKQDDMNAATSPEPKVFRGPLLDEGSAPVEEDEDMDENDPDWNRTVCYSQVFEPENMIQALVLAVRCGLEALSKSDPPALPPQGGRPSGVCAVVNETGMVWKDLPTSKHFAFDYEQFPDPSTKMFYLWRHLGRGSKGQAFLACNSSGRACAAKFYLLDEPTLHRETNKEERAVLREKMMEARKREADAERDMWTRFYNEFSDNVQVVKLNRLWCLLMPYMEPIMKNDRRNCISAVKNHLQRFKSAGLRYRDNDLRWRHAGVRNNQVYLFDLGSLGKFPDTPSEVNSVNAQVALLEGRILTEIDRRMNATSQMVHGDPNYDVLC